MKHVFIVISALLITVPVYSQSAFDNPCGALSVPVVESADPPTITTVQATGITYTAFTSTGTNNCSPSFPTDPDVWFKFTAPATSLRLIIQPPNGNGISGCANYSSSAAEFLVLTGNCSGPFAIVSCGRSDMPNTLALNNLTLGTTYYVKITFAFGYTCGNIGIAAYTGVPPAAAKVGINTNQPADNLDVAGTATFRNVVKLNAGFILPASAATNRVLTSDATGKAGWQDLTALSGPALWTSASNSIYNLNSGNVGIGTNTPASKLHVNGQLTIDQKNFGGYGGLLLKGNVPGSNYPNIAFSVKNTNNTDIVGAMIQGDLVNGTANAESIDLNFFTTSAGFNSLSEKMRIKGNGNVGIGVTNPFARLAVSGPNQEVVWLNGPTGMYVLFAENGANRGYFGSYAGADPDIEFGTHTVNTSGSVHLSTTNVPRLTVSPAGNIGIGLSNPTLPLSFPASFGEKISLYPGTYGSVGLGVYGGELRLHCDIPNGKVSLGTLDVNGMFIEKAFAGASNQAFTVNGTLNVNGTIYNSDTRFKKNIKPLDHALTRLKQIEGVEYEMLVGEFPSRNFKGGRQMGLIAQNVEQVIPEAVETINGDYKGVDYARLVPLLIESIKEQQVQIEAQQKEINALKNKIK